MSGTVDYSVIDRGFEDNLRLRKLVYSAIASTPQHASLFEDIARYTCEIRNRVAVSTTQVSADGGPAQKKRKLAKDTADPAAGGNSPLLAGLNADAELQFYTQDTSFAMPQRKKLLLEVTRSTEASAAGSGYLRARNQVSKEIEFGVPISEIQHVLCLPVPEKTQRQFNFCIIPKYADGVTPAPAGATVFEPIIWTVPDGPPRTVFLGSGTSAMESASLAETYESYMQRMLNERLKHTKVICPSEKEFVSPVPEAHRKGEKAYHVKAFRGSKEGFLFFLSTGIFFGYKKPLLFFSFDDIESISYTSVLQRTFNLNVATRSAADPDKVEEIEFSMIDQSNHPGIDAYIQKHQLQDASLAVARRAKKLNINGAKGGDEEGGNTGNGGEGEESELQKAHRELEDQEEEEEEDYDPGSDGESDGSGSSSEEDSDAYEYGNQGGGDGRNLVQEELGSEAEDVDIDE
ncbi:hypothetical protein AJ80_00766 [Polytolypa hystricis UAMH7299]|uniref:Histone chaperone RTT106/FACT complex subunit SPT16-like middle domain-containing protein n=1 Tax=Polytolypa hystricis (strain UAMH7299) TaxID=1447883 RepID=A0A2B7Z1Q0_POLH7|nr:hypothetical protein AJ80_00766 [Polytolypa hystricis UAMH7299]